MSAAHLCDQEMWLRALPLPQLFWLAGQTGCRLNNVQAAVDDLMMRSHEKLKAVVDSRTGVA